MADERLIFPVGFDLDAGVKEAEKDWKNIYYKRLQEAIDKTPLKVKLNIDANGLDLKSLRDYNKLTKEAALAAKRAADVESKRALARQRQSAARVAEATEEARIAKAKALSEMAQLRLNDALQNGVRGAERLNSAYSKQSTYLSRLVQRIGVYFGLYQVAGMIRNIREITAEFELQRVSLGALIQDTHQANVLFGQIKAAAVESPYQIKELVNYTKQLAAYGVEQNKLFDTVMQYADVAAGLGADMSRINLAMGQIRAAGVLKGTELRQLTELGIPMVQLLSDKLSELRGELVTTGEVFSMISDKAISFKMVEEIFNDLTGAGGRFYNMQQKQSETLAGQWSNMQDTIAIAYEEMGNTEALRGAMEGIIGLVKSFADNWKSVFTAFAGMAEVVVATKLFNKLLQVTAINSNATAIATKRHEKAQTELIVAQTKGGVVAKLSAKINASVAASQLAAANATRLHAKAWHSLIAAMKKNAFGLILTAIAAIVVAIVNATRKANELRNELDKIGDEGATKMQQAVRNFERLAKIAVDSVDGTKRQTDALNELKRTYGDIIPSQDLQIDKLRAMNYEYDSLTQAIKEKIAMQTLEQEISTIQEDYGEKINKQRKEFRKYLEEVRGLSESESRAIVSNIEQQIVEGTFTGWYDALQKAAKEELMTKDAGKLVGFVGKQGDSLFEFIDLVKGRESEIKRVTDEINNSGNALKKYADWWDEAGKAFQKATDTIDTTKIPKNTKLYDEEVEKRKVKSYADFLRKVFKEEKMDKIANEFISDESIDFKSLWSPDVTKYLSIQAKNAVRQVQDALAGMTGWQAHFAEFSRDLKIDDVDRKVFLYTDEEISNFGSLNDALEQTAKKYKELKEESERYGKALKGKINPDEKEQLTTKKQLVDEQKRQAYAILETYNALDLLETKGGKDDWVTIWKNRAAVMKDFQQGVEDLTKKMGYAKALAALQDVMLERGTSVGIDLTTKKGTADELKEWYKEQISKLTGEIQKMGAKEGFAELSVKAILKKDTKNQLIQEAQSLLQWLYNQLTDFETKTLEENLKKTIDELARNVARSKEAKDFYDKMLGMTGDTKLASELTLSVYGGVGDDLKENIKKQLTEAFKGVDISSAISGKKIDYKALEALIDALPEDMQKNARKLVEEGIKANAQIIQDLYKTLIKFEDYESKRVNILRNGIEERRKIEEADLAQSEKDRLKAASKTAEDKALAKLEYEDFKSSDMYITMFENLDYVTSDTLRNMRQKLLDLKTVLGESLDPAQLKEIVTKMEDIDAALSRKNPFKTLSQFIKKYKEDYTKVERKNLEKNLLQANEDRDKAKADADAKADAVLAQEEMVRLAEQEYGIDSESAYMQREMLVDAKNDLAIAKDNLHQKEKVLENLNDQARAWRGIKNATKEAIHGEDGIVDWINSAQSMLDSIKNLTESFGVGGTASEWIGSVSSILGGAGGTAAGIGQLMSGNIAQGLANTLNGLSEIAIGIFDASYIERVDAANREIEKQEKALSDLSFAYDTLQRAQDDALGSDYISNYSQRIENLQAQQEAYNKQAQAERDKGKKADEEAIRQYEESARETAQKIADMEKDLSQYFLGTDVGSAARDFAVAWMDAYKDFESTSDAIKQKFADMVQNMIVESLASKVIQGQMEDIFDMVDSLSKDGQLSVSDAAHIAEMSKVASENIDVGMTNLMNALEAAGISVRGMGTDLTGISKDIATASEESILGLAAGINTQNFYISQVPPKLDTIIAILQGGANPVAGVNVQDLITIQNQHLAYLPNIATNTLNTADRCERAAIACESALSKISSVISVRGTASSHIVNTN